MNQPVNNPEADNEHDQLKEQLLETTIEILRTEGAEALSLRNLAEQCGTSTQMIYTIFGGKQGLLEALYERGARQLADRCGSVPDHLDPFDRLEELGRVYREFALDNRELYGALFQPTDTEDAIVRRTRVFDVFKEAVEDCIKEEQLPPVDPVELTDTFWAAAHGAISLQIAGYYSSEERARNRYNRILEAVFEGYGGSSSRSE